MTKFALLFAASAASITGATAVSAQSASGIVIIDQATAVNNSTAMATAIGQIKTTYAANIAQVDARAKVLDTELRTKATAFDAARRVPNANKATLQSQYAALQTAQQQAQSELANLSAPYEKAKEYAVEQIAAHLPTALKAVMAKRSASLVLAPVQQVVISYSPSMEATADLTAELNVEVPTVSIAAPANWQPGQPVPGQTPAPAASGAGR
ncbi:MAG: OmpH family outer membrane protein [Alphaproteobacteria bacterium]|nr:OmpH family outer membrane protein [Alphaproteobacteria bacterium]MDE2341571.1 OmpH family outer membrane protein [Alphaproteobacteria bacterium]